MSDVPGLDRFGHLTELSLNRLASDDPASDPPFFAMARAHLATCERCRSFAADFAAHDQSYTFTPPAPVVDLRARRLKIAGAVAGVLAIAAAVFIVVRKPAEEVLTKKGVAFHFAAFTEDSRVLASGDSVPENSKIGFVARADHDGHLVIVTKDSDGHIIPVYPEGEGSRPFAAHQELTSLGVGLELFGAEPDTFTAFFCEQPFTYNAPPSDCVVESLTLKKTK